ncbi:MAG: GNAT family N-acetyltransferase [Betaproteobacteria bacterium]|nr:GNAT family N-acetyltransferase [Betaproteobacteria bacterium]
MPPYELLTGYENMDVNAIHAFLSKTYWSPEIPVQVVDRAARNSMCFGVRLNGEQVAFARVVTDKATFAYLADVYVLEEHRGKGVSRLLLDSVFQHPDLQGLRRFLLATRDAHGLYTRYGFTPLAKPSRMMEAHNPDAYAKPAPGQT